jgi:hypothetical protein
MGLLEVGPLPKTQRGTGRKPGTWRGHAEEAEQLRNLPAGQWGKVLAQVQASRAQQIVSAIKNGTAADFRHGEDGSKFTAHARKSKDQAGAPTNRKGQTVTLYDVWARYLPPSSKSKAAKAAKESKESKESKASQQEREDPRLARVG